MMDQASNLIPPLLSSCGHSDTSLKHNLKVTKNMKTRHNLVHSDHCSQKHTSETSCPVRCNSQNKYSCYSHIKLDKVNKSQYNNSNSTVPIRNKNSIWHCTSIPILSSNLIFLTLLSLMCLIQPTQCIRSSQPMDRHAPTFDVWDFRETLDEDGAFVVEWTPDQDRVIFRVTVRTKGYIGFGLSSSGRMDGADIVVGWVHSGKAYLQDRHGKGNNDPMVDEIQDWMLVWGFENDTHTLLIMTRPYDTCDPKDHVISNDTVSLLWAYHPDDPVDPESPRPRLHYHGDFRRGARSAFLLQRPQQNEADILEKKPSNTWTLSNPAIQVGPFSPEASDTLYWCKIFKRPPLVQKNHIVKYEPVFTPGSRPHVHHMIVYECTNLDATLEPVFEELSQLKGHPCYQNNMSQLLFTCNHVVVVWAVGSEGLSLPAEAGYPLTPNGPKFYMMETHYDVPGPTEAAFKDSSGVRIHYTSILRNYDAGVLSVGLDPNWKHLIPPRQPTVLSQGHCVAECTERALPTTGINVFAVILHTHLLGRKVSVRHIRRGRELEPIAIDNNYDFNYQEYRALQKSRQVLPGDHLIGECVYNSMERSTITLGGFKTRDEKCLSFLFYWPRVDLSFCHSKPSLSTVLMSLGIHELSAESAPIKIKRPVELAGKTLEWRLQNYDWENHFEHFQQATRTGSFNQMCWKRGQSIYPELEKQDYDRPNITNLWMPNNACASKRSKKIKGRRRNKLPRPHGSIAGNGESLYNQHHRQHHHLPAQDDDGNVGEGDFFEDDVMFDDTTYPKTKHIERIDVDPPQNYDVILPVITTNRDPIDKHPDRLDTTRRKTFDDKRILKEEFKELEDDLEREINRLPERKANSIVKFDTSSGFSVILVAASRTYICISLCILLLWS